MSEEELARELHEAGREAVLAGQTQNPTTTHFVEWNDSPLRTKEGRRSQARYLLSRFVLTRRPADEVPSRWDEIAQDPLIPTR